MDLKFSLSLEVNILYNVPSVHWWEEEEDMIDMLIVGRATWIGGSPN